MNCTETQLSRIVSFSFVISLHYHRLLSTVLIKEQETNIHVGIDNLFMLLIEPRTARWNSTIIQSCIVTKVEGSNETHGSATLEALIRESLLLDGNNYTDRVFQVA